MAKLCLKKTSKRKTVARVHRIEKKVKEHNKKLKKEVKKNKTQHKNKKKRDKRTVSIPNACPFKEELLMEAEKTREAMRQAKLEKQKLHQQQQVQASEAKRVLAEGNIDDFAAKATNEEKAFAKKFRGLVNEEEGKTATKRISFKAYAAEVRKTIDAADVIIEVLDARDPLGSRSKTVEEQVIKGGKRLILLLNKIDLVPKEVVLQWLKYLRPLFPTIAFKASTQQQNNRLGRFMGPSDLIHADFSKCMGADIVMRTLGNYSRNKNIRTSIRVGIVGFPNVGKSSVINSLKRQRCCNVGATPGITKEMQVIQLDKLVQLIDTPGVVLAQASKMDAVEVALKNAIRLDQIEDPVAAIQAILRRCPKDMLIMHYNVADFQSCEQFLAYISRKIGRLSRGGRPNFMAAAKHVLRDWNNGVLRYYTVPPEEAVCLEEELGCSAAVLSGFSQEFDIDSFDTEQQVMVEGLPNDALTDVRVRYDSTHSSVKDLLNDEDIPSEGDGESDGDEEVEMDEEVEEDDDDESEEEMETEERANRGPKMMMAGVRKRGKKDQTYGQSGAGKSAIPLPTSLKITGNVQLNKEIKNMRKKQARVARLTAKHATKLAKSLEGISTKEVQEDYEFIDC